MELPFDSGPPAPVDLAISDVPVAPVAVSFTSDPPAAPAAAAARRRHGRPSGARRVAGWAIDLAFVALAAAGHLFAAARILGTPGPLPELLLVAPLPWCALAAGLALAWSWIFVALRGRTPGMALTGQRLSRVDGRRLGPLAAFVRALLALLSAAPGLFGFLLALVDPRGQTLHDKLCRCLAVVD